MVRLRANDIPTRELSIVLEEEFPVGDRMNMESHNRLLSVHGLHGIFCISSMLEIDERETRRIGCHPYLFHGEK